MTRRLSADVAIRFMANVADGFSLIHAFDAAEVRRMGELMQRYASPPIDLADGRGIGGNRGRWGNRGQADMAVMSLWRRWEDPQGVGRDHRARNSQPVLDGLFDPSDAVVERRCVYTDRIYAKNREPLMPVQSPESRRVAETTVFQSGNSQAIRIPKEFQFHTKRVEIRREGRDIVLRPLAMTAAEALADLPSLDDAECLALDLALADADELPPLDEPEPAESASDRLGQS